MFLRATFVHGIYCESYNGELARTVPGWALEESHVTNIWVIGP